MMSRKFAVFDIDGTLIRWQLYHAIVDQIVNLGYPNENAKHKLKKARMVWKNRQYEEAFSDYEKELIRIYESSFNELRPEQFDQLVDGVIDRYKDQVYTFTRDLVQDLRQKGYFLIAISGSHQELVEKLAQYYNFDSWVGTKYERIHGKFSGKKYVPSMNKSAVLHKIITENNLAMDDSYAVGDTISDLPVLEMVDNPIAFNPEKKLLEASSNNGWKIVIERKNVIYQLDSKNRTW